MHCNVCEPGELCPRDEETYRGDQKDDGTVTVILTRLECS